MLIGFCGDLVNDILYGMKEVSLPPILSEYFLVVEPYYVKPTGAIKLPKVKLQTAAQPTRVLRVNESFVDSLGKKQKDRNDFSIYRNEENQTTSKVYHSPVGGCEDCLEE